MFVITIKTDSDRDVDNIKEVLERAAEEGEIAYPFALSLNEVNGYVESESERLGFDNGSE